ncbi:MAG: ATP-binding protein [Prochloraceae cyanobacterium]
MKFKFVNSLKFKLALFVGLGIVPAAILFVIVASSLAKDSLATKTEELLILKTTLIKDNVEKWDEINRGILRSSSSTPAIVSMNPDRQKEILLSITDNYNHLYRAMTVGMDGWNVARSDSRSRQFFGNHDFVRNTLEGADISYESIVGRASKKLAVCMGRSVADRGDGEVVGVMVICSHLQQIAKEIGQLKFGRTGYAILVDSEGKVLAHPNPAFQLNDKLQSLADFPPVANLLANGDKDFNFRYDNINWVSRSVRLQNGWGAIVVMSQHEYLADEREFEKTMLFVGLVSTGLLALLAWNLGNHLIKPISELNRAAIALSRGKYRQVDENRKDELGNLGRAFNKMADAILKNQRKLEQKVNQSTASLREAHEATKKALVTAQNANLDKENFINKITHELKTPLNAVIGYSQILMKKDEDRSLRIINQSGKHLSLMLDDIFDFKAAKLGKITLKSEPVDLKELADDAIDIIKISASEKLSINAIVAQNLPTILADRKRLLQVLMNLLTNAIKFTATGEVSLRIYKLSENLKQSKIIFEVKDTGIGIASENLKKIFSPYFSTDGSNGTGLGLSISNQIVSAMGGKIEVESELNHGSTFSFKLSLTKLKKDNQTIYDKIFGYKGNTLKILVVDDDRRFIDLICSLLLPIGFEVIPAYNGLDAIAIASKQTDFDLILNDYYMPTKSGTMMIYQLRTMPSFKQIPIIISSSERSQLIQQHSIARGANAFLSKPLNPEELIFHLEKLLKIKWITKAENRVIDFQQKLMASELNLSRNKNP